MMSSAQIRNKIFKSIDEMDAEHLQSAYLIIKEFANQQKFSKVRVENEEVEEKITRGIKQLDNGEGSDFAEFLNEMNVKYAGKK